MRLKFWVLVTFGLLLPAALFAQIRDEDFKRCGNADPDISIAACTSIIQSETDLSKGVTFSFYNRGVVYNRKESYDRAISDFNHAIG